MSHNDLIPPSHFMAVLTNPNSMQENQNSSSQKRGTFYHPATGLKTPEDFILQKKETNISLSNHVSDNSPATKEEISSQPTNKVDFNNISNLIRRSVLPDLKHSLKEQSNGSHQSNPQIYSHLKSAESIGSSEQFEALKYENNLLKQSLRQSDNQVKIIFANCVGQFQLLASPFPSLFSRNLFSFAFYLFVCK